MNLHEMFKKHDSEFINFNAVENKRSRRKDLHAFMLLDEIVPDSVDIISGAEHDEIFLSIDCDRFEPTEEQVIELIRCGVRYDDDGLCMFV